MLTEMLLEAGQEVVHLSRTPNPQATPASFGWDVEKRTIDPDALKGVDSIIHLAGAGIADKPWTSERKREIIESRVDSANLLFDECVKQKIRLKHFISASAIGWYPMVISDDMHDEESEPGNGFLADVCKKWEHAAARFKEISEHVSIVRVGLVLAKGEGALKQISLPVRLYVAAGLGKGTQHMSWIHKVDVCRVFEHVLENDLHGIYNAVGPDPITNEEFMQILADVMEKPMYLPNVPEFMIRMMFGEKAQMVLRGVPVSSEKIQKTGFTFDFPTLNSALMQIYSN